MKLKLKLKLSGHFGSCSFQDLPSPPSNTTWVLETILGGGAGVPYDEDENEDALVG